MGMVNPSSAEYIMPFRSFLVLLDPPKALKWEGGGLMNIQRLLTLALFAQESS